MANRSHSPKARMSSCSLSIISLLIFLQVAVADNRTFIPVDLKLSSPNYANIESVTMQSNGFLDMSLLGFTSLDNDATVDIAVFVEPEGDADYSTIGIGIGTKGGDVELCCSAVAQQNGDCTSAGRLIIDKEVFDGVLLSVTIPAFENVSINPFEFDPLLLMERRGSYSVLFASCSENTTTVEIEGIMLFDSYVTEEEIENSVPFYVVLTLAYLGLLLWFGYLMRENRASSVRLEEYIFAAIALGLVETAFATIDYALHAQHMAWLTGTTIFFGTCKNGLSRCVLMMVSMGWGVTVASLPQKSMIAILVLGASYAALQFTFDMAQMQVDAGVEEEDKDDDLSNYSKPVQVAINLLSIVDFIIWFWILMGLNMTIKYLEDNQQERKLQRYKWLLNIMIIAVVMNMLAVLFLTMEIADGLNVNITLWPATTEAGFFLVVACVAYLWRPNPNAREYAYVEELNSDESVYELELTEESPTVLQDEQANEDAVGAREFT